MSGKAVRVDPTYGFRYFAECPPIDLRALPADMAITIPLDGGFWIVDRESGIRYRRICKADMPKETSWNTRGRVRSSERD